MLSGRAAPEYPTACKRDTPSASLTSVLSGHAMADRMTAGRNREAEREALAELVRAAACGDDAAFRQLVEAIHARIYRWAVVRTGDADLADDVAQEVLVRVHRALPDYEGRGSLDGWLYRITANVANTMSGRAATKEPAETEDSLDAAGKIVGRLYAGRVTGLIGRYLADLPERQREIFDLVDLQGYTPAEAAEMLEMNSSTVRVHLLRARRRVRGQVLERHPELEGGYSP